MPASLAIQGGTPVRSDPFPSWPVYDERDRERLIQVLESRRWAFEGPFEREFERAFAARHTSRDAVTVTNGTVALLLCLRALGIKPGDEVILPALTWVSTATAVLEANAVPVMVDVDPRTFCIDPSAVAAAVTGRTVAIVPVHLYSCMADMDAIGELARKRGLAVIEDCAHAHGARWGHRGAGSLGHLGSFSFQMSKVMTAGEGGAVVGNDRQLLDRIYSLKNCGRHDASRGTAILGGNHRLTEWQAAILLGQLDRLDSTLLQREAALSRLRELVRLLRGIAVVEDQPRVSQRPFYRLGFHYDKDAAGGIPLPRFIEAVRAEGVPIEPTYPPVYDNPLYHTTHLTWYPNEVRRFHCAVAERVSADGAFMLPHEILLGSDADLDDVAAAFGKVLEHPDEAAGLRSRLKDRAKGLLRTLR